MTEMKVLLLVCILLNLTLSVWCQFGFGAPSFPNFGGAGLPQAPQLPSSPIGIPKAEDLPDSPIPIPRPDKILVTLANAWLDFTTKYAKGYVGTAEELVRKANFFTNFQELLDQNERFAKGLSSWKAKVYEHLDQTKEEFLNVRLGTK